MMTREEAIAKIEEQYKICQEFYNLSANPQKDYPDVTAYMEALDMALSELRSISREQVEKVWRGEWDYPKCEWNLPKCPKCGCNSKDATYGHKNNFCPRCGLAMTGEAVDMVMERLEALHGET